MKGFFETMAGALPGAEAKTTDISALTWEALFGWPSTKSGVAVNVDTALRTTTVLACTRVLAEGVAQLPFTLNWVDKDTDELRPAKDSPLYRLLHRRPNDWMTSFELRETLMVHAVLTGMGIAVKNVLRGQIVELLPVPPQCVTWQRLPNFEIVFHINDPYGIVGTFRPKDLLIIRGPAWDSMIGLNIMREAREAIGLAIATEESHARLHANGARPGGILSIDNGLSAEARDRIKEAAKEFTRSNAYKTMVLDKGATWTSMGMTGVDAQHLETRRYQVEEICRAMRVFPHMVGYTDKTATFASAESFFQGHVLYSLMPWLERFVQSFARDVLPPDGSLEAMFNVRELIRGDTMARAQFYASGIVNGWLVRNDARKMEGLPPLPGLDEPLTPLNMRMVGQAEGQEAGSAVKSAVAEEVRSWMGHNGGPPMGDDQVDDLTTKVAVKIGRVLSAVNEGRIRSAHSSLGDVLGSL